MRALPLGFDPADHYVVMRPFTFDGVALNPGDPIPESMDERRKRQYFELRKIHRAPRPQREISKDSPPAKGK